MKIVKLGKHFGVQSKYSDSLPAFVDCQKDSECTGENGTQVKPVLLAVEIFIVWFLIILKCSKGKEWVKKAKVR